jgi:DNA-binding NtrC family response regulator
MLPLILIVEDEVLLANAIAIYLECHAYATAVAYTGEDGLRLAAENNPDVAVVDLRLPGLDGLKMLRHLREVSPGTEVVMITAYASIATAVEAMQCGVFHYLSKPLDLVELCAVVAKALTHEQTRQGLSPPDYR